MVCLSFLVSVFKRFIDILLRSLKGLHIYWHNYTITFRISERELGLRKYYTIFTLITMTTNLSCSQLYFIEHPKLDLIYTYALMHFIFTYDQIQIQIS